VKPVSAGPVQLKVPENYAELASAPAIPGLDLIDGAAYAPDGDDGGRAVAFGATDANDSTLLPTRFRGAIGLAVGEAPDSTPVTLGPEKLEAYRLEGQEPAGIDRQVTVFTVPTSEGVATIVCLAPPADAAAFKPECDAIANTLQLTAGRPFRVGPDEEFANTLGDAFGTLGRQVAKGRQALNEAGATFREQGAAARDIQAAYAAAAAQLRDAEVSPADQGIRGALVERLDAARVAWKNAADAAVNKQKARFDRSEAAIKRTQEELARQVAALEEIGYEVGR
jgi:hypothetical protein